MFEDSAIYRVWANELNVSVCECTGLIPDEDKI
jgi:hypothetical protein